MPRRGRGVKDLLMKIVHPRRFADIVQEHRRAKPGETGMRLIRRHTSNSCAEILESVFRQLQLCLTLRSDERFICG